MPNLPISQLPAAGSLTGTELFAVVQDGVTKYTTLQAVNTATTVNYGLFNQTGSSIPVTGSGTGVSFSGSLIDGGIGTLSVPANSFTKGDAFSACMTGKITATNNHTLEIKIISDGVDLADTGVITLSGTTDRNWRLDIDFSINEVGSAGVAIVATAGTFQYRQDASNALIGEIFSFINSSSFDTTIDNTLQIEAIWGTTSGVTDSIYSQIFTLNKTF
jgi:hypothetical protein